MAFGGVFGQAYVPPAVNRWWLDSNSISESQCVYAYKPVNALSYVQSKNNQNDISQYALDGATYPDWSAESGWTFATSKKHINTGATGAYKPISIIAKISVSSIADHRTILGSSPNLNGPQLRINTSGLPEFLKSNAASVGVGTTAVSLNTDTVIGFTYSDAGAYKFYFDGTLDNYGTNDQAISDYANWIGAKDLETEYFLGNIYAIATYNVVLTAAQVLAVTNAINTL